MSFKAVILLKSREAVFVKASAKKTHFKYGDGLYVITEKDIQNVKVGGRIVGAEAIYFEGNPNAVGYAQKEDSSESYLNEIVTLNALKQMASGPKFQLGAMFDQTITLDGEERKLNETEWSVEGVREVTWGGVRMTFTRPARIWWPFRGYNSYTKDHTYPDLSSARLIAETMLTADAPQSTITVHAH